MKVEKSDSKSVSRKNRSICLPFSKEEYIENVNDSIFYRKCIDERINLFPELFPTEITKGYLMKDLYFSIKQSIPIRRIEVDGIAYTIRPSFVMPYMTGAVKDVENALFLRKFNVPFWAIARICGRDAAYWYRIEQSLGRNSIVGTTIKNAKNLPSHIGVDEKHSWACGKKVYIATTVGNECILGASIAVDAGEEALINAYQVFKSEAQGVDPSYSPTTVNMDGWKATFNAWAKLFTSSVLIFCFLHIFIKIRDRAKKKHKDIFLKMSSKLWECYRAKTKRAFSQKIRRLIQLCKTEKVPSVIIDPIQKLRQNLGAYTAAYDFPHAHRTSNMLDRLMQRMDRHLFSTQYFHGSISAAELSIRGWALIQNFAPSNPRTVKKHNGLQSPAERLNRFRYHDSWLQSLLVSASLGGWRSPPQNPK
jgi:hypothetical protein